MVSNDKIEKLRLLLCELKLEQRHLNTDMNKLLKTGKTIDFFQAKHLNSMRQGLAKKINSVESNIDPNIIA